MNRLIATAALLLAATNVSAKAFAYADIAGGSILAMYDDEGDCRFGKLAILIPPFKSQKSVSGCWSYDESTTPMTVTVQYEDGDTGTYTSRDFKMIGNPSKPKPKGQRL